MIYHFITQFHPSLMYKSPPPSPPVTPLAVGIFLPHPSQISQIFFMKSFSVSFRLLFSQKMDGFATTHFSVRSLGYFATVAKQID